MIRRKVVTGMRETLKTLRSTHKNYGILYERGARKAAVFLRDRSLDICPIDTGALRASVFIRVNGKGFEAVAIVGYDIFYAVYVHENLENFHPVGQAKYLEQPIREFRDIIVKIIFDEMKKSRTLKGRFRKIR